jgi:hypothetical protein
MMIPFARYPVLISALSVMAGQGYAGEAQYNFAEVFYTCLEYVAGEAPLPFGGYIQNVWGKTVPGAVVETRQGPVTIYLQNEGEPRSCWFAEGKLISRTEGSGNVDYWLEWDMNGEIRDMAHGLFRDLADQVGHVSLVYHETHETIYLCDDPYAGILVDNGTTDYGYEAAPDASEGYEMIIGMSVGISRLDGDDEELRAKCLM